MYQAERPPAALASPFNPLDYPWALGLSGYLLAVSTLLLWMLAGRLRIHRWLAGGDAVIDARVLDTFNRAGERIGLPREIPVLEHPGVPAPMTCRILRPVVILPAGFAETLSDDELRAVAFHELAHVRRRDTLVFTLVSLLRTVFFQPLLWLAARRISYLAEVACDSAALEYEGDPAAYAELLTRIAFRLPDRALSTEMAVGILLSNSAFFRRVREILSNRRKSVRKLSRWALAGIAVAGVLCLLAVAVFPLGERREGKKITISGKVLHEGKPVVGATVYVSRRGEPLYFTYRKVGWTGKKNGSFSFRTDSDSIDPQQFVVAFHPKYATGWKVFPAAKERPDSDSLHAMFMQPYRSLTVKGRVLNSLGQPFSGVDVSIVRMKPGSEFGSNNGPLARTDGSGRFTLQDVLASEKNAHVSLNAAGYRGWSIPVDSLENPKYTKGDTIDLGDIPLEKK